MKTGFSKSAPIRRWKLAVGASLLSLLVVLVIRIVWPKNDSAPLPHGGKVTLVDAANGPQGKLYFAPRSEKRLATWLSQLAPSRYPLSIVPVTNIASVCLMFDRDVVGYDYDQLTLVDSNGIEYKGKVRGHEGARESFFGNMTHYRTFQFPVALKSPVRLRYRDGTNVWDFQIEKEGL